MGVLPCALCPRLCPLLKARMQYNTRGGPGVEETRPSQAGGKSGVLTSALCGRRTRDAPASTPRRRGNQHAAVRVLALATARFDV